MRRRSALVACAVALLSVSSAAGGSGPVRLVPTKAVKTALRAAFLRTHSRYRPQAVAGPLKGRIYYGRYNGREYALATFSVPATGTTDQPENFRRPVRGRWKDLGDTGGEVCPSEVPAAVAHVWHLTPAGDGCFFAA